MTLMFGNNFFWHSESGFRMFRVYFENLWPHIRPRISINDTFRALMFSKCLNHVARNTGLFNINQFDDGKMWKICYFESLEINSFFEFVQ